MWSILGLSLFYSAFAGDTTLRGRILAEALYLSIIMARGRLFAGLWPNGRSIQRMVFLIKFGFLLLGQCRVACRAVVVSAAIAAVFVL